MAMKIEGSSNRKPTSVGTPVPRAVGSVTGGSGAQFGSTLGRHMGDAQEEYLRELAEDIMKQGETLAQRVDVGELKVYKRKVAEFLDEAVRGFGKFAKDSFLDRRGRHRVYATVKTVNDKLEELTQEVLKSERDNLTIVSRIEDIRGLVLDLFL